GAVPAQEADVPAARQDADADVGGGGQPLERLDGDERVVAGGEDQGRHGDARDERGRGGGAVVVQGVGEAAPRGRVQVVEEADGRAAGEVQRRQVGEVALAAAGVGDEVAGELVGVEAVARQGQQLAAALQVDGRGDGADAGQARHRGLRRLAGQLEGDVAAQA